MGWSGSLTENSALGSSITFTPDTEIIGDYSVSSFKAPRKGVYKFVLNGSGGAKGSESNGSHTITSKSYYCQADGGEGGSTTGYLLLEKDQVVYVGCGGACSAAFVSSVTGANLAEISEPNLYFVAGGGGQGGSFGESHFKTGYNCYATKGGNGGGTTGADGEMDNLCTGGGGGTQSEGGQPNGYESSDSVKGNAGAYGKGGLCVSNQYDTYVAISGRGGDGYYGGGSGYAYTHDSEPYSARGYAGGGGSGFVKTANLTVRDTDYVSTTSQGGGATSATNGSVVVSYHAKAELPIIFNGVQLEQLFFNGVEIESLIFNGTKLFIERVKQLLSKINGVKCHKKTSILFSQV